MADSDRDEELDAEGLRLNFGLRQSAILCGLRLELYPFQQVGPSWDRTAVLWAQLDINGTSHHLEAIALAESSGSTAALQFAAAPDWQAKLERLYAVAGSPGQPFEPVMINGRRYVIGMTPYCV